MDIINRDYSIYSMQAQQQMESLAIAIRNKEGSSAKMTSAEMADKINALSLDYHTDGVENISNNYQLLSNNARLITKSSLTNIGNILREKSGYSNTLTTAQMTYLLQNATPRQEYFELPFCYRVTTPDYTAIAISFTYSTSKSSTYSTQQYSFFGGCQGILNGISEGVTIDIVNNLSCDGYNDCVLINAQAKQISGIVGGYYTTSYIIKGTLKIKNDGSEWYKLVVSNYVNYWNDAYSTQEFAYQPNNEVYNQTNYYEKQADWNWDPNADMTYSRYHFKLEVYPWAFTTDDEYGAGGITNIRLKDYNDDYYSATISDYLIDGFKNAEFYDGSTRIGYMEVYNATYMGNIYNPKDNSLNENNWYMIEGYIMVYDGLIDPVLSVLPYYGTDIMQNDYHLKTPTDVISALNDGILNYGSTTWNSPTTGTINNYWHYSFNYDYHIIVYYNYIDDITGLDQWGTALSYTFDLHESSTQKCYIVGGEQDNFGIEFVYKSSDNYNSEYNQLQINAKVPANVNYSIYISLKKRDDGGEPPVGVNPINVLNVSCGADPTYGYPALQASIGS